MLALRAGAQRFHAQPLSANNALKDKLLAALPFKPTGAQAALPRRSNVIWHWMSQ
jgi:ATP-dependent DNA helicase RecG